MDIYKVIGKRIKAERTKRNLTQEELADRAKIGSKFLSNIERGVSKASLDTVVKLSKALDIPLDILVDVEEYKSNPPHDLYVKELSRILAGHSPEDIRKAIGILKVMLNEGKPAKKKRGNEAFLI